MRTNIVLNDELVKIAMRYSKAQTKKALIEDSLRTFIKVKSENEKRLTYENRYNDLISKLSNTSLSISSIDLIREDRERV
ncbi:type II toxin-antitoxin system VapB family antitoxin [bacterium]|nr:type II toxin-antitoxin system VapB family antitoxin [bacterium]